MPAIAEHQTAPLVVPLKNLVPLIEGCKDHRTLIRLGKHPNHLRRLKMKKIGGKWHSNKEWLQACIEAQN